MPASRPRTIRARLTCLGTADGLPSGDRFHSSYLYELAGQTVLVDCGESVCRHLVARRLPWDQPDAVLLSHAHADHIGGFLMLVQGLWLGRRRRPLDVYCPASVAAPLQELLRYAYLFPGLIGFPLRWRILQPHRRFRVGSLTVTPFATTHLAALAASFGRRHPVGYEAFGFVMEGGGRRVVHSADLGAATDLAPWLEAPTDLLVAELAHFTMADFEAVMAGRPVRQAALIHLPLALRRQGARLERRFAARLPGVRWRVPADGESFRF